MQRKLRLAIVFGFFLSLFSVAFLNCSGFHSQWGDDSALGVFGSFSEVPYDTSSWEKALFAKGDTHLSPAYLSTSYNSQKGYIGLTYKFTQAHPDGRIIYQFARGLSDLGLALVQSGEVRSQVIYSDEQEPLRRLHSWSLLGSSDFVIIAFSSAFKMHVIEKVVALNLKDFSRTDLGEGTIPFGEISADGNRWNFIVCDSVKSAEIVGTCQAKSFHGVEGIKSIQDFQASTNSFYGGTSLFYRNRNQESNEGVFRILLSIPSEASKFEVVRIGDGNELKKEWGPRTALSSNLYYNYSSSYYVQRVQMTSKLTYALVYGIRPEAHMENDFTMGTLVDNKGDLVAKNAMISPDRSRLLILQLLQANLNEGLNKLEVWTETGLQQIEKKIYSFPSGGPGSLSYQSLRWSVDGTQLAGIMDDGKSIFVLDLTTEQVKVHTPQNDQSRYMSGIFFSPNGQRVYHISAEDPFTNKTRMDIFQSNNLQLLGQIEKVGPIFDYVPQESLQKIFIGQDVIWVVDGQVTQISPQGITIRNFSPAFVPLQTSVNQVLLMKRIAERSDYLGLQVFDSTSGVMRDIEMPQSTNVRSISPYGWSFDQDETSGWTIHQSDDLGLSNQTFGPGNPGYTLARNRDGRELRFGVNAVQKDGLWGASYSKSVVLRQQDGSPLFGYATNSSLYPKPWAESRQWIYNFADATGRVLATYPSHQMNLVSPNRRYAILANVNEADRTQRSISVFDANSKTLTRMDGLEEWGGGNGKNLDDNIFIFSHRRANGNGGFVIGRWDAPLQISVFEAAQILYSDPQEKALFYRTSNGPGSSLVKKKNLLTGAEVSLGVGIGEPIALFKGMILFSDGDRLFGQDTQSLESKELTSNFPIGSKFSTNSSLYFQNIPIGVIGSHVLDELNRPTYTTRFFDRRWQMLNLPKNEWVTKQHSDLDLAITTADSKEELRLITNKSGFAIKSLPWDSSEVKPQSISFVPGKPWAIIPIQRNSLLQIVVFNFDTFEYRTLASLPIKRDFSIVQFAEDGSSVVIQANGLHRNFNDLFKFDL